MARSERFDRIEPACGERRGQRPERRIAAGEDSDPLSRSRPFLTLGERGDAPRDAVAAIDEAHPMRARRGEFGREPRKMHEGVDDDMEDRKRGGRGKRGEGGVNKGGRRKMK